MRDEVAPGTQYQPPKIGRGWSHASKPRRIALAVIVSAGLIAFEYWAFGTRLFVGALSLIPGFIVGFRPAWIDRLFLSGEERTKGWSIRPRRFWPRTCCHSERSEESAFQDRGY
jgi:hypothetical protein